MCSIRRFIQKKRLAEHKVGFIIVLLGVLLMSLDPIFIRYSGVDSVNASFLFGLFTAFSMPIVLMLSDKRGIITVIKQSGWPLLAISLLMSGSASGLVFSINNTYIANTYIILTAIPIVCAVLGLILLKEMPHVFAWLAIILVIIGVLVVTYGSSGEGNLLGDGFAAFSVICIALALTLLRKYQNVSRLAAVSLGGILIAIIMFTFAQPSQYHVKTWITMGLMGLFTAPIGRVLSMVATRYITATEVSLVLMLETILTTMWGFIFFNEKPNIETILGGILIFVTIFFYTLYSMSSKSQ